MAGKQAGRQAGRPVGRHGGSEADRQARKWARRQEGTYRISCVVRGVQAFAVHQGLDITERCRLGPRCSTGGMAQVA